MIFLYTERLYIFFFWDILNDKIYNNRILQICINFTGKPHLTQHGPYTYLEERQKYDIVYNNNGTVTYKQNKIYRFMRNMSIGEDTDEYMTLNFPVVVNRIVLQSQEILFLFLKCVLQLNKILNIFMLMFWLPSHLVE